jgi:hypothetical protein
VKEIDGISDPEIKYQAQRELAFNADIMAEFDETARNAVLKRYKEY